jgi:putative membrane protein
VYDGARHEACVTVSDLPGLNALLNATSALLLGAGYVFIRRRKIAQHRACMLLALLSSTLFLASYLIYHYHAGSVPYRGGGWTRPLYYSILFTHTILAAAVVPLALITVARALRRRFDRHVAIARYTLPVWIYVSVTGVVIYLMLYGPPVSRTAP